MAIGKSVKKIGIIILKIFITVIIISFVVNRLGWENIVKTLSLADYRWFIIGLCVFFLSSVLGVFQWMILLKNKGITLSFKKLFVFYFIGISLNNLMFGILAGDAVKIALIKYSNKSGRAGFAATFLDRFAGLWIMMFYAVLGSIILLIRGFFNKGNLITAFIALITAFIIFCLICSFIISRRIQRLSFYILDLFPLPKKRQIKEMLREITLEVHNRHILFPIVCISLVIQLLRISVHMLCAASLGLLKVVNFQYFFIFIPVMAIIMLIPLPFGVKEISVGTLFQFAGLTEDAIVMEFLVTFIGIITTIFGGFLFITNKITISDLKSEIDS